MGSTNSNDFLNYPPLERTSSEHSTPPEERITIHQFSHLDEKTQAIALQSIASINKETSTAEGITWENYTQVILNRLNNCKNSKNTLFIARFDDRVIGYVAFYTRQDLILYINQFLENDSEAYCSFTAVDQEFRGQGLAEQLKIQIFNSNEKMTAFKGHIKKTNRASLRVLEKFSEMGFSTEQEKIEHQVFYTVRKQ